MGEMDPYIKAFHETLLALGQENLDNLIIVGGWCPYLYAEYLWKRELPFPRTLDIDFAVKNFTPDRFSEPVYRKLLKANLIPTKSDVDDENRIQFRYLEGKILVPIDFITAPAILPRGQKRRSTPYVACDAIDEVAFAMRCPPIRQTIEYMGKKLVLQICSPAAFIVVKGLLVEHRTNTNKTVKDLGSIAFMLQYAPDPEGIIAELKSFKNDEAVKEFRTIIKKLFGSRSGRGTKMLEPTYREWGIGEADIRRTIEAAFGPLLAL